MECVIHQECYSFGTNSIGIFQVYRRNPIKEHQGRIRVRSGATKRPLERIVCEHNLSTVSLDCLIRSVADMTFDEIALVID